MSACPRPSCPTSSRTASAERSLARSPQLTESPCTGRLLPLPASFPHRIGWLLLLPSCLCLDAPFVALGWARTFAGTDARAPELASLFFAVWAIYLADRLYDRRRPPRVDDTLAPRRHQWARRHPRLLASLALVAQGGLAVSLVSGLQPATIRWGLGLAGLTLLYQLGFRGPSLVPQPAGRWPAKELGIATIFAAGVATAATAGDLLAIRLLPLGSFACLVTGNCLLIARTERHWDELVDPAAFYSRGPWSRPLPEGFLLASLALALLDGLHLPNPADLALVLCAGATWILGHWHGRGARLWTQASADALLLLPWVLIPALRLFLPTTFA